MTDHNQSLSWRLAPMRELIRLAWPICISMLSYAAMTVADTAFVSRLGDAALAGVGLGGMLAFTVVVFGIGLLRGVKVAVSQAVGANTMSSVAEMAAAGLILAAGLAVLTILLGQVVLLLVPAIAATPQSGIYAGEYLAIRLLATPFVYVFCTARETSYGVGDSRSPMIASVLANVVNISLDYVFIFVLETGPVGAAWATLIASAVEAAAMVWLGHAMGFGSLAKGVKWVKTVLTVGVPTGLQFAVEVGAFTVMTIMVASMSETAMAAHQIALSVVHFAFLPAVAISEAASVMVGQAVGAERDDLVPTVAGHALMVAMGYALFCTVLLLFGTSALVGLFGSTPEVSQIATTLFYLAALFLIGDAANIIARGVLRGCGDVRFAAVVGVCVSWISLPPVTWYLGIHCKLGAVGAWIAITTEIAIAGTILWWRFRTGRWRHIAAVSRAEILSKAGG